MWSPPAYQDRNGPIVYYLIRLEDQWYSIGVIEINTTVSVQFTMVNNLEEYDQYSCEVAAATRYGVGPYNDPIFFTTFEDGSFCVHKNKFLSHNLLVLNTPLQLPQHHQTL